MQILSAPLMFRFAAMLAVCGCASSAPVPTSTPVEAEDTAGANVPESVAVAEPVPAEEPAESTAQQLLVGGETMYWLVPQPGEGAGVCRAFEARPASRGPEGWIEPARPVREDVEGNSYVQGEDGSAENVANPGPAPFRRVTFSYRYGDARVELHSPRGLVGIRNGLLATCSQVFEASELPWFGTEAACEAAASSREPLDLGACAEAVLGFPAQDQARDRLQRVTSQGGQIHELERGPDGPRCRRWRLVPPATADRDGQMIYTERGDNTRTRVSYQYWYAGHILQTAGPASQSWEDGRRTSSMSMGCAETYYVHHPSEEYASVGGARWYYRAADCERAVRDPEAAGGHGHGGC